MKLKKREETERAASMSAYVNKKGRTMSKLLIMNLEVYQAPRFIAFPFHHVPVVDATQFVYRYRTVAAS